jgi:hypothetical protein
VGGTRRYGPSFHKEGHRESTNPPSLCNLGFQGVLGQCIQGYHRKLVSGAGIRTTYSILNARVTYCLSYQSRTYLVCRDRNHTGLYVPCNRVEYFQASNHYIIGEISVKIP